MGDNPEKKLVGKVALITGGARGIGLAVAKAFAREGARVFIVARSSNQVTEALNELRRVGATAAGGRCDLTQRSAAENLPTAVIRQFGKIDILVNNAAVLGPRTPIINYDSEEWHRVIQTNLNGAFWLTKAVLGTMIPANQGSIINVSSGVAKQGRAEWGAYSVSKAALNNFTEVLAEEVKGYGIRVNSINPGATRTSMRAAAFPKENPLTLPTADDVTPGFIYLASDLSRGLTGAHIEARDFRDRTLP